jgi:hypothetical protein
MSDVRTSLQDCVYDSLFMSSEAEISADVHNAKCQGSLCSEQTTGGMDVSVLHRLLYSVKRPDRLFRQASQLFDR